MAATARFSGTVRQAFPEFGYIDCPTLKASQIVYIKQNVKQGEVLKAGDIVSFITPNDPYSSASRRDQATTMQAADIMKTSSIWDIEPVHTGIVDSVAKDFGFLKYLDAAESEDKKILFDFSKKTDSPKPGDTFKFVVLHLSEPISKRLDRPTEANGDNKISKTEQNSKSDKTKKKIELSITEIAILGQIITDTDSSLSSNLVSQPEVTNQKLQDQPQTKSASSTSGTSSKDEQQQKQSASKDGLSSDTKSRIAEPKQRTRYIKPAADSSTFSRPTHTKVASSSTSKPGTNQISSRASTSSTSSTSSSPSTLSSSSPSASLSSSSSVAEAKSSPQQATFLSHPLDTSLNLQTKTQVMQTFKPVEGTSDTFVNSDPDQRINNKSQYYQKIASIVSKVFSDDYLNANKLFANLVLRNPNGYVGFDDVASFSTVTDFMYEDDSEATIAEAVRLFCPELEVRGDNRVVRRKYPYYPSSAISSRGSTTTLRNPDELKSEAESLELKRLRQLCTAVESFFARENLDKNEKLRRAIENNPDVNLDMVIALTDIETGESAELVAKAVGLLSSTIEVVSKHGTLFVRMKQQSPLEPVIPSLPLSHHSQQTSRHSTSSGLAADQQNQYNEHERSQRLNSIANFDRSKWYVGHVHRVSDSHGYIRCDELAHLFTSDIKPDIWFSNQAMKTEPMPIKDSTVEFLISGFHDRHKQWGAKIVRAINPSSNLASMSASSSSPTITSSAPVQKPRQVQEVAHNFKCSHCSQSFSNQAILKQHVATKHSTSAGDQYRSGS